VVPIELPPLRHRREDIPYLVEHFLERIRQESGKPLSGVDARTLDLLMAHTWPGNIRELINALQFASVRTEGGLIMPEYLPPEVRYGINRLTDQGGGADDPRPQPGSFSGNRTGLTRETVLSAIASSGGNKAKAAKLLGVGRATLYRFMKQHID
jgi:DNA-binding NtrC family response regulator